MSKGKLFVISGASGVGKGTVISRIMAAREDVRLSVSATTRAPRPSECHGVHYYFVTEPEFKALIAQDKLLEYDFHNDTYYGTPREQMEQRLELGHVILDIDPKGAFQVRQKWPGATFIFIMPPSFAELERRLKGRGDTSAEQIEKRLNRAKWEMEQRDKYDHVVVNDDLDRCVEEILNIIANQE